MIAITTVDGQTKKVKNNGLITKVWFEGNSYTRQLVEARKLKAGDYILTAGANVMKITKIEVL